MKKKRRKKGRKGRRCDACGASVPVTIPRDGGACCAECVAMPLELLRDFRAELRRIETAER